LQNATQKQNCERIAATNVCFMWRLLLSLLTLRLQAFELHNLQITKSYDTATRPSLVTELHATVSENNDALNHPFNSDRRNFLSFISVVSCGALVEPSKIEAAPEVQGNVVYPPIATSTVGEVARPIPSTPAYSINNNGYNYFDMSLDKAVQKIWDLDTNRMIPDVDYVINVQQGKKPSYKTDCAPKPLFTRVNTKAFFDRPTYRSFISLLDNYVAETGTEESVTSSERKEEYAFLRTIMQTEPMQFCHMYCYKKKPDSIPLDPEEFIKLLHTIWFGLYDRSKSGLKDSSGFEHVFVGEVKNGEVSGFHNWIHLYLEEKKGAVDYRGYIYPRNTNDVQTDSNDQVLTLQFLWNGIEKFVDTSFIGVSPEFEMALYTTCFLVGSEKNEVKLDTGNDIFDLDVKCFRIARNKIGTTFVESLAHEAGARR